MTEMLKISNLSKRFGQGCPDCSAGKNLFKNYCPRCGSVYSLQDINFELWPCETLGIVGESGSGKSTLMRCLYFDTRPTEGDYRIQGHEGNLFDMSSQKRRHIRNHQLGMVYQNPHLGLRMELSSISNIVEKPLAAGLRQAEACTEIAKQLLEKVHLPAHRYLEKPKNFSGGMQQRVQIAKALSNQPPILFLDEVTTGLDLSVQASVLDLILTLQREGQMSLLVVSHDLAVIRMLAQRTIVMKDGRIVEQGLTDQILEDPQEPYTQELVYSLL